MKPIKKTHLILGSLLFFVLGCAVLYFSTTMTSSNKTLNKDIPNKKIEEQIIEEKVPTVKKIEPSYESSEEALEHIAFGYNIGEKINPTDIMRELKLTSGEIVYEIKPKVPYANINNYFVTVGNEGKVKTIRAIETFDNLESAEKELGSLNKSMVKKCGNEYKENDLSYYKDKDGKIFLVFMKPVDGKYEVHMHCIFPEQNQKNS